MSRVLIIPDVHLKPWIFDMAEKVDKESYDNIVVLGDLVDDWGMGSNLDIYKDTFDRAAKFGKDHETSLWCYGNHDVSIPKAKDNCLTELEPEEVDENGVGRTLTCIGFRPLPDDVAHAISKKYQLFK